MALSAEEHAEEIAAAIVDYIAAADARYADRDRAKSGAYKKLVIKIKAALVASALAGH